MSKLRSNPKRLAAESVFLNDGKIRAIQRDARTVYRKNGETYAVARKCIACILRVPFLDGSYSTDYQRVDYNHCIPRSLLSGQHNWPILHSPKNLSPTCRRHHDEHDARPDFWLPLMAEIYGYTYDEPPFNRYLKETHATTIA